MAVVINEGLVKQPRHHQSKTRANRQRGMPDAAAKASDSLPKKKSPEGDFLILPEACAGQAADQKKWRMPNSAPLDLPPADGAAVCALPLATERAVPFLLLRRAYVLYSAVRLDRLYT